MYWIQAKVVVRPLFQQHFTVTISADCYGLGIFFSDGGAKTTFLLKAGRALPAARLCVAAPSPKHPAKRAWACPPRRNF